MVVWIDVLTVQWTGGWMHYVYRSSKGCTSCCFFNKFAVTLECWLKLGKSNGHFTFLHLGHTLSTNHQIFFHIEVCLK